MLYMSSFLGETFIWGKLTELLCWLNSAHTIWVGGGWCLLACIFCRPVIKSRGTNGMWVIMPFDWHLQTFFNGLNINEFSSMWTIVALFWKPCLSGWLELREHYVLLENWCLLQKCTQEQFFVSVVRVRSWCGPSRILRWIYSFSLPFSSQSSTDPIFLFRMFSNLVWYLHWP
jgi:hypothetical protein